ncbi:MAG: acetolactate synthase large subunit [candidate division Zixibacteria bacterium]|nr:acetolactate synthase large subunit [candidate division Zixibacteria bacterium]
MKASELFVQCLQNEGVEYIFGLPGEENIAFLEAVRQSDIKFVLTRHEQTAAFMADVWGRLTGKAGVCLATIGPGATNLITPIADAFLDRSPLVAITGQASTDRMHKESHQYINIVSMLKPITKWNTQINQPEIISESVRKAFKLAEMEKPGSTHLELPENIAEMDVRNNCSSLKTRKVRRPAADYKAINQAMELIKAAKKPLILCGNGAIRKRASKQLKLFLDKIKIAVCNTFMAKGAANWDYDYNLLTIGLQSRDHVSCAIEEADLIIAIGYDLVEYSPSFWNPGRDKKVIHIDFTEAEVDQHYHPEVEIVADIAGTLWELNEQFNGTEQDKGTWASKYRKLIMDDIHEYDNDTAFPVKPQKLIHDIRSVLADDDILISDVGAHKMWIARMYVTKSPNSCIISNGFASMGIALPGALAAKLIYPDRNVLAVCGDGGFLMNSQDLETAVRLKLPIVIMIWNDNSYGLIEWKQKNHYGHSYATKVTNPDFVKFAESFGAVGMRIEKAKDVQDTLKKAFAAGKPVVVEVAVDYRENIKLTEKLGKIVCPI